MKKNNIKELCLGIKDAVPISLGYFAVSFTFGMMAVSNKINIFDASLISFMNLTSAGQFAGLDIIISGGTLLEMALAQLVINLRYSLMSFSIGQKLEKNTSLITKLIMAVGITDEIYGIDMRKCGRLSPFYHIGAYLMAMPGWVIGTIIGGIFGTILPINIISALTVAIYGMFMAIIIPPCKLSKGIFIGVLMSMILSGGFYVMPFLSKVSKGISIIIITVLVSMFLAIAFPVKEEICE